MGICLGLVFGKTNHVVEQLQLKLGWDRSCAVGFSSNNFAEFGPGFVVYNTASALRGRPFSLAESAKVRAEFCVNVLRWRDGDWKLRVNRITKACESAAESLPPKLPKVHPVPVAVPQMTQSSPMWRIDETIDSGSPPTSSKVPPPKLPAVLSQSSDATKPRALPSLDGD